MTYFIDQQKATKKTIQAIYRADKKKLKKYWESGIELSINDVTKSPQIYTLSLFLSMSEKNSGIYGPVKKVQKVTNS